MVSTFNAHGNQTSSSVAKQAQPTEEPKRGKSSFTSKLLAKPSGLATYKDRLSSEGFSSKAKGKGLREIMSQSGISGYCGMAEGDLQHLDVLSPGRWRKFWFYHSLGPGLKISQPNNCPLRWLPYWALLASLVVLRFICLTLDTFPNLMTDMFFNYQGQLKMLRMVRIQIL